MFSIHIPKAATTFDVDFDALPEPSRDRVIRYGLTQLLSDATAPIAMKRDGEPLRDTELAKAQTEAKAAAQSRLDDLKSGVMRKTRASGGGDPVAREYRKLITSAIQKSPKFKTATAGMKLVDKGYQSLLAEYVTKYTTNVVEKYMAEARRIVAAQAELSLDIDL